jgi:hypothetical protein
MQRRSVISGWETCHCVKPLRLTKWTLEEEMEMMPFSCTSSCLTGPSPRWALTEIYR